MRALLFTAQVPMRARGGQRSAAQRHARSRQPRRAPSPTRPVSIRTDISSAGAFHAVPCRSSLCRKAPAEQGPGVRDCVLRRAARGGLEERYGSSRRPPGRVDCTARHPCVARAYLPGAHPRRPSTPRGQGARSRSALLPSLITATDMDVALDVAAGLRVCPDRV